MNSYAQLQQDLIALDYFNWFEPKNRIFVDCGAFDGIGFSNTRLFFEQGWSGLCIEASQKNYQKLERLYRGTNVITVRAAVADFEGEMELNVATIPGAEDWGSDVSSLSEDTIKRWPNYIWEKEMAPVTTLDKILEANKIQDIDLLSIDVEGLEMGVLKGLDLSKYHPNLIVVEYSNQQESEKIIYYLTSFGYFCWLNNGQDLFLLRGKRRDFLAFTVVNAMRRLLNLFVL